MADRYCDPSLGGTTTAAGTAPTGGYADDGDGNATTRATAGTVVITVTDYTQWVAGSDSLSIIGATAITIAAPSSNNDMASKLATAINASTATNGNSTVNPRTSRLGNLVNAVASGAAVTIYTRTGGTAWNSLTCTTTKAAAFSTTFPVTFSGATAGAWAYLANVATAWPQALTGATYGLWCATLPFTGALTAGDVVHVRSNNITLTYTTNVSLNWAAQGSAAAPITYLIDNNNKWADGADKKLTLRINAGNNISVTNSAASVAGYIHIKGYKRSDGTNSLVLGPTGTPGGSGSSVLWYFGTAYTMEHVDFSCESNSGNSVVHFRDNGGALQSTFINCRVFTGQVSVYFFNSFGNARLQWIGGAISNKTAAGTQVGTPHPGIIGLTGSTTEHLIFIGVKFVDFVTASVLVAASSYSKHVFSNCNFGNVTVRSPVFYTSASLNGSNKSVVISSQLGQRDWSIETGHGIAEWNSSRSFPTRNALQFDGATKWSMRFCASTASGTSPGYPLSVPRIGKINSLAAGTRTVTVHFVLEKTLTWTAKDIFVQVQYTNTSGDLITINSQDPLGGALTTDVAGEWSVYGSGADSDNVVWNNAGNIYHKQYKIAVSCPDMETDTDVGVFLVAAASVSTTSQGGFVDPDFDIA